MRDGTAWIVAGLGVTVVAAFLPPDTATGVRLAGCFVGVVLIALGGRGLVLNRRCRSAVEAAASALQVRAKDADLAYIEVVKDFTAYEKNDATLKAFMRRSEGVVDELLGADEARLYLGATAVNAYATAKLPGGEIHTSLLIFKAWLEERRARLLGGDLALRSGTRMPAP